jgi:hypothetical protein
MLCCGKTGCRRCCYGQARKERKSRPTAGGGSGGRATVGGVKGEGVKSEMKSEMKSEVKEEGDETSDEEEDSDEDDMDDAPAACRWCHADWENPVKDLKFAKVVSEYRRICVNSIGALMAI